MQNEFNEETKAQSEETTGEDSFVYKAVMKGDSNRRTFSVVYLIAYIIIAHYAAKINSQLSDHGRKVGK